MNAAVWAIGGRRLRLMKGDITKVPACAIGNAANAGLRGGGGVDGAIHAAGGPDIMRELDAIRPQVAPLSEGGAVATTAGRLPARYVLHAAGPVWRGGSHGEAEALAACYQNCLQLAEERGCETVSFPSISTGIYGYPVELAAPIAVGSVSRFLRDRASSVTEVIFVLFDQAAYDAYARSLGQAQGERAEHA